VVADILATEAVLIANPNTHFQDVIKTVKSRIEGIINANKFVHVLVFVSVHTNDI